MKIELNLNKEQLGILAGVLGTLNEAVNAAIAAEPAEGEEVPNMNEQDPTAGLAEEFSKMR